MACVLSGETYAQEEQSIWKALCNDAKCSLRAATQNDDPVPVDLHIYKVKNQPVLEITTPLGISLQKGVVLAVDEKTLFSTRLLSCEPDGCHAFTPLNKALLQALKRGLKLSVVIMTSRSRQTLAVNFSLLGFTKQYGTFSSR